MKKFMDMMVAAVVVAGMASVAGACGGDKSSVSLEQSQVAGVSTEGAHTCAGSKKACTAGDKQACAERGAKSCSECAYLGDTRTSIEKAGGRVEVVKLKNGYALIATAGSAESLAAVRKVNAERFGGLAALAGNADKKFCKDCTAFNKALKADAVSYEIVDTANGVMTVFTGTTAEAIASLKESCGMFSMLKAEAKTEKTTASN
jgi:hypothetical protein